MAKKEEKVEVQTKAAPEAKAEVVVEKKKVERNLQSIDYRKSYNQPLAVPNGIYIRPFLTKDNRRGLRISDAKTGKILAMSGIGKTGEFYGITELEFLQWKKEEVSKEAITV